MTAIAECRLQSIAYSGIVYRKLNRLEKTLLGWGGSIINLKILCTCQKSVKKIKFMFVYISKHWVSFLCVLIHFYQKQKGELPLLVLFANYELKDWERSRLRSKSKIRTFENNLHLFVCQIQIVENGSLQMSRTKSDKLVLLRT